MHETFPASMWKLKSWPSITEQGDLEMSKETGGPAFPMPASEWNGADSGMTLRDHFAGLALQGMITTSGAPALNGFDGFEGYMAKAAYKLADEMLKYRSK